MRDDRKVGDGGFQFPDGLIIKGAFVGDKPSGLFKKVNDPENPDGLMRFVNGRLSSKPLIRQGNVIFEGFLNQNKQLHGDGAMLCGDVEVTCRFQNGELVTSK